MRTPAPSTWCTDPNDPHRQRIGLSYVERVPHFHTYDGLRLHYSTVGQGPPMVCLASGPGADASSLGDLGGLARHRTLIRLGARGGGQSEIPSDRASCPFPEQVKALEALCEHLGLANEDEVAAVRGSRRADRRAG